jgi:hypothetical protein
MFPASEKGECIYCSEDKALIVPSKRVWSPGKGPKRTRYLGVCDLCSYALRHAWKRELGEIVCATTPRTMRTYLLVPRLPEGRSELDVSAYEFLVDPLRPEGRVADPRVADPRVADSLPYLDFCTATEMVAKLSDLLKIVTWPATLREVYLGYAGTGDFASVMLAWAWGDVPGARRQQKFASFAELLSRPTPDAGFYLGVKAAFEALLWRHEVGAEMDDASLRLCVHLGEGAVRVLEDESSPMTAMFRANLDPSELEVVRLVEESRKFEAETAPLNENEMSDGGSQQEVETDETPDESVPPGYARTHRGISRGI